MHSKSYRKINRRNLDKSSRRGASASLKMILTKILCLLLITNILTLSVPAAPSVLMTAANETYQDIRFGFNSGSWGGGLPALFALFAGRGTTTETVAVSRIKIYPGSLTVRQKDLVVLSAVGFDSDDEPLNGLAFEWTMTDSENRFEPRRLVAGSFKANTLGVFKLKAVSGGKQDEVTITVIPKAIEATEETSIAEERKGEIPASGGKNKINVAPNAASEQVSSNEEPEEVNMRPGDPDWNADNSGSSNDPGNQPGNPPGGPADDGAGSGNFQLSAPVVSLPGRGIDLALNLNYNSRLWNKSGNQLTYNIDGSFPAPGWSLGFGKMVFMGGLQGCMLIDADGTRHNYAGTPHPLTNSASFEGRVLGSSNIDYGCHVTYGPNGSSSGWAKLANGTTINYASYGYGDGIYPVKITDVNGNYITITYVSGRGSAIETITDTMGRIISFQYDSNNRLISITTPRMTGRGVPVGTKGIRTLLRLHYRQLPLSYSFPGKSVSAGDNAPWVIDSIYYPATKTGYWFGGADSTTTDYNAYYSSYGMIAKVEEQHNMNFLTGPDEQGTIVKGDMSKLAEYNYPMTTANIADRTNGLNLSDAPTYTKLSESWAGMDVTDKAITTYDIQQNASPRVTTVTQPNGAVSRQYAYNYSSLLDTNPTKILDGMVYQDESYVEDPNGSVTIINKTYKQVGKSFVQWEPGYRNVPRVNFTETFDENNHKLRTEFDHTNGLFNQVTRSCDYDNNMVRLRCTATEYENSSAYIGVYGSDGNFYGGQHVLNLVKATGIKNPDAGETLASWTKYEYDNYQNQPFVDAPGVIQHEQTYNLYTTELKDGMCLGFDYHTCTSEGEIVWIPTGGGSDHRCNCIGGYEQVSVYDPNTEKRGNVTKVTTYTDAQNQAIGAIEETRSYDITGNLITASTSCCEQTSFQYTNATQYAYPTSQTRGSSDPNSPHRMTTTTNYSFATGLVVSGTDANGRTSSGIYNPDTLRPTRTISSTGAYSTYSYSDSLMTVTEELFEAGGAAAGKTVKTLNGVGQTRREESVGPNNVSDFVDTKYNKFGQVWKQSRPYRAGGTLQWTETIYDQQGRRAEVIAPDDSRSKVFYNQNTAAGRPDSATLDGNNLPPGNTIRVTDAWGRERWGRFDQQNRLVEVVEPKADGDGKVTTAGSLVTKYQYDTLGRLIQTEQVNPIVGQSNQIRKFKYDSLGRLTRQKLAEQNASINDAGVWVGVGATGAVWSKAFTYDNRSNLTQKTDARGVKTNYAYYNTTTGAEDPLNRVQAVVYDLSGPRLPDSVLPIHPAYNVTYEYMTTGDKSRIKKVETPGLTKEEYVYDAEGRVQDYTQTIAARETRPFVTSYLYDTLSRVTEVRYPAQYGMTGNPRRLIEHTYDTASRLTSLKVNGTEQAGEIAYNAADQTTAIKIGATGANQVTESYTFDPQTGLLTSQKAQNAANTLLDLSYEYDRKQSVGTGTGKTGHLSKIVDNRDNNKNLEYKYDALGRLTKAKGGVNDRWTQTYTYDRYGNRTNVAATGVAADNSTIPIDGIPNLAYDTTSNRITTSGYQYDAAGNQIRALAADGVSWVKYEYDAANRLRIVKKDDNGGDGTGSPVQVLTYGASNARIFDYNYNTNYLTVFATLGGTTLSEYTEAVSAMPVWRKSYVYLGSSLLSTATPNGTNAEHTEYSHPDRLGTRAITNQQAGTSYEQTTLPFGTALNAESTANTNNRFTSYDRSSATGLDYAVNRQYDSKQGRFTQVDPIGISASSLASPQTLNLYSYCGNDPINYTDPDGLFFGSLFKWISKIIKIIMIAVAITIAVIAMVLMPSMAPVIGYGIFAKMFAMSGLLLVQALAPPKIGAVIGIITGMILSGPGIIANFSGAATSVAEKAGKIAKWLKLLVASNTVGSIANSMAQTKKGKETSAQRQQRILGEIVRSALWRLENMPGCKEAVQGKSSFDPTETLNSVKGNIKVLDLVIYDGQTTGSGTGPKATLELDDGVFDVNFKKGNIWGLNAQRTRTLVLLHELTHAHLGSHPRDNVSADNALWNNTLAEKCFGVKPQ